MIIKLSDYEVKEIVQKYLRETFDKNILICEFSLKYNFDAKNIDPSEFEVTLKVTENK